MAKNENQVLTQDHDEEVAIEKIDGVTMRYVLSPKGERLEVETEFAMLFKGTTPSCRLYMNRPQPPRDFRIDNEDILLFSTYQPDEKYTARLITGYAKEKGTQVEQKDKPYIRWGIFDSSGSLDKPKQGYMTSFKLSRGDRKALARMGYLELVKV